METQAWTTPTPTALGYTPVPPVTEMSHAHKMLKKMAGNWGRRAQVKRDELNAETLLLEEEKADFRVDLLPFHDHPDFLAASDEMKTKILSCAWLAYNEKTVGIEAKIVTPACIPILYGEVPGLQDEVSKQIASQTMIDEAYHVLLVVNACRRTREKRDLLGVRLPEFNLIVKMHEAQAACSAPWQKIMIQLATAIVSEVFISDYLKLLSTDTSIPAFNRLTVDVHRHDEMAHSGIFKNLARSAYTNLSSTEREFVADILPKPVRWFASLELDVWQSMLTQIGFAKAAPMINDCRSVQEENMTKVDYSGVTALAAELGMLDSRRGADSFCREGLLK